MAVKWRKLGTQPCQIKHGVEPAQQVIVRNPVLEIELIKQTVLQPYLFAQHLRSPWPISSVLGNHAAQTDSTEFFNSLGYKQTDSNR